jgi:hypothetical protein
VTIGTAGRGTGPKRTRVEAGLRSAYECVVGIVARTDRRREPVTLLVGTYRELSPARREEMVECLRANAANDCIAEVVVFREYDASRGDSPPLHHPKVRVVPHGRRLTFRDLFGFANRELRGKRVIIANSDIYFDRTLARLDGHDLTGKLLCLSRWDVQADGSARFFEHAGSQDAWIFRAPVPEFPSNWHLGLPGCESRLAYEASKAGLSLSNPGRSIRAYHLHLTHVRNYSERERLHGAGIAVHATSLGGAWLWIIVACRGQLDDVRASFATVASQPLSSAVFVDFGCPEKSGAWVRSQHARAIVVDAGETLRFNRGEARNRGAALTDPDAVLCFLDPDVAVAPDFAETILAVFDGTSFLVPDGAEPELASALVCSRAAFERAGGYDPNYAGWAHDDSVDLQAALERVGCARRTFPASLLAHRKGQLPSPSVLREVDVELDAAYRRSKIALVAEVGERVPALLLRDLRRAMAHRRMVARGLVPEAPRAAVTFEESMGYTVATLLADASSHNNDPRPFEAIPEPLAGLAFTQVVACCVSPIRVQFRSAGKLYVLVGTDWDGHRAAADYLRDNGYREPLPFVRTRTGTGFEVWSLVGEAGDRFEIPTQAMLVARELVRG